MTITNNDILNAFLGSIRLNMKIMKEAYQVQSLELAPEKTSPLYLENDTGVPINLHLPSDAVIGATTLINKAWDLPALQFVEQVTNGLTTPFCLVDIGANVGLFSRQCLNRRKNISTAYLYEPHPGNFNLLRRNLHDIQKVNPINAGLGPSAATMEFYLDSNNAGNYSLNAQAMEGEHSTMTVSIIPANAEKVKWLQSGAPIIYKSDTQGFDEVIATSYDLDFWDIVKCGSMELWRLKGKNYDRDKFIKIMDKFPRKVFSNKPNESLTSSMLAAHLQSEDGESEDILFWRD